MWGVSLCATLMALQAAFSNGKSLYIHSLDFSRALPTQGTTYDMTAAFLCPSVRLSV